MHDYTFSIAIPWWLALVTLAGAIGISVWAYWRLSPPLSQRQRLVLTVLRSIALCLLVFALWQPLVGSLTALRQEPQVAILLDNSSSLRLRDAAGDRAQAYRAALRQLQPMLESPSALLARFDASVTPLESWHPDSLSLDGPATDIAQALRWAASEARRRNVQAVLLISDGVVTAGSDPVAEAEMLGKPVVTILVGDTTPIRDLAVQSMLVNERVPLGSQTTVYALLTATGLQPQTIRVELWENARRTAEQTLNLRPEQSAYTVAFTYTPQSEGFQRLSVRVPAIPEEATQRNNEATAFVEVSRLRRRILLFAGSPSPDFAFLRRELQRNPLLELSTFVHKDATTFYEGQPSPTLLRQADAFILVDFPTRTTPEPVVKAIAEELARDRPIAVILGPLADPSKARLLEPYLPITFAAQAREHVAAVAPTPTAATHPLTRTLSADEAWRSLPPLIALEAAQLKPNAEILATAASGAIRLPFFVAQEQPRRSLVVLGYGLHRWKLMGFAAEQARGRNPVDHFSALATNLTQWLLAAERSPQVRIRTTKRFYAAGEPVRFWASVTDPEGNPVTTATVSVRVVSSNQTQELLLQPAGAGVYQGSLSGLPSGEYAFSGTATLGTTQLGSDRGRFSIGDIGLEARSLQADAELLRNLAARTGGAFFTADSAALAWEFIRTLPGFRPVVATTRREIALWHSPWLLALALLILSAEWFLRRRWGLV
ncbi:MAG: hypothetical protein ABDH31_01370 [Chlorobiota bacterium]